MNKRKISTSPQYYYINLNSHTTTCRTIVQPKQTHTYTTFMLFMFNMNGSKKLVCWWIFTICHKPKKTSPLYPTLNV
jgi:hypothetical protein